MRFRAAVATAAAASSLWLPNVPAAASSSQAAAAPQAVPEESVVPAHRMPPNLLARDESGRDVVLTPMESHKISLGIGRAEFLRFACGGGVPSDAVISLSTISVFADPVLLISLDADAEPNPRLSQSDGSSAMQWREDAVGDHYIRTPAVGPRGGILAIINTAKFANGALEGELSIRCSPILAFDPLFWNNLVLYGACPVSSGEPCSGHGRCMSSGDCRCVKGRTGNACEHGKLELAMAAMSSYSVAVESGRYQYFKVRVPPRFVGGFLQVDVNSSSPFVVLLQEGRLPTKSRFGVCNFEDWVESSTSTRLKYRVAPTGHGPLARGTRNLAALATQPELGNRSLLESGGLPSCSRLPPPAVCKDSDDCEDSCMRCARCDPNDERCAALCEACRGPHCMRSFSTCAVSEHCTGRLMRTCEQECGGCLACLDSDDDACRQMECFCCEGCLPIAAKCGMLAPEPGDDWARYVYVGLFNHRVLYSDSPLAYASVRIELFEDPGWEKPQPAAIATAAHLQRLLETTASLSMAMQPDFPKESPDVYNFLLGGSSTVKDTVSMRADHVALLHVENGAHMQKVELTFRGEPLVSHVLVSSRAAPKTIFDFDMVVVGGNLQDQPAVVVHTNGRRSIWCAVIGKGDGSMLVAARAYSDAKQPREVPIAFAFKCVLAVFFGLMLLAFTWYGVSRLGESMRNVNTGPVLSERFAGLLGGPTNSRDAGPASVRGSYGGYVGTDVLERNIEDRYLHRGGFGDDGI